tara:strand:- start:119 stop:547 length:429 start_codon:yes stop_codon:yes gene_type:complete
MKPMWDERWLRTEKGFFSEIWNTMKKRCSPEYMKKYAPNRKVQVNNGIRGRDHLLELWEKQKKLLGGPYCMYTGVELTTKRSRGNGYSGRTPTNISMDRIDPSLPYQEDNIVFCSWEFNDRKAGVTIDDCKLILKIWEERNA